MWYLTVRQKAFYHKVSVMISAMEANGDNGCNIYICTWNEDSYMKNNNVRLNWMLYS